MSNPCDIEISAGYLSDSTTHQIGAASASTGLAAALLAIGLSMAVIDQAQADDFAGGSGGAWVIEQAVAADSVTHLRTTRSTRLDRARAADRTAHTLSDAMLSSSLAAEVVADRWHERVLDHANAASLVEARAIGSVAVTSTARARDLLLNRHTDTATESAVASDSIAARAKAAQSVLDGAAADDFAAGDVSSASVIIDRGMAADFTSGAARGAGLAIDLGAAGDFTLDGREESVLWTCPSETLGMSRLLPGGLHSLAVVDGVLCACSLDGLVALDAPAEDPKVATGLTDFGSPAMKRASYVYVGYQGEPLTLAVGNTGSGAEATYSYPLPARSAQVAIPSRAPLGRGARSRYWRFTLTGTAFQLHDVELVIDETSRKI